MILFIQFIGFILFMRKYFYIDAQNQQCGPVEAQQLPMLGVTLNTYVWADGMSDWKMVADVPELSGIFIKQQESQSSSSQSSYSQPVVATPQPVSFWKKTMALWFALACFAFAALSFWLLVYLFTDGKSHTFRVKTLFLPILLVIYGFKFVIEFIKDMME